ncbi:hypothetical protein NNG48_07345 [Enterococcus faecium]|nr:hypothetical protein [Enterococcus faecium]
MQGVYIISKTMINLSLVKAIYGDDEFVCFDMIGENRRGAYQYNGYSVFKVREDIKYMQRYEKKVWGYAYEY